MWKFIVLLLLIQLACGAAALPRHHGAPARRWSPSRRLLDAEDVTSTEKTTPIRNNTFIPPGPGSWEDGGSVGTIMVHANLMHDGRVVGWGSTDVDQSQGRHPSAVYDPATKTYEPLLGDCGIHDCKNAFCSGQVTTVDDGILIFGGHGDDPIDLKWFRRFNYSEQYVSRQKMSSARWYPTPLTLADGRVLVVGGVPDAGDAGYDGITRAWDADPALDNPTYEIYDPAAYSFSGDRWDMSEQLGAAAPIHTYPHVVLMPDGGVAVSAGSSLAKYDQVDYERFAWSHGLPSRPGAPWSYPQTGAGTALPMRPPYDTVEFLAAGGASTDYANEHTRASSAAQVIELTGGPDAEWQDVGPMPRRRVMGDAVILCDGTIGVFNGAGIGIGGWNENDMEYRFKDGTSWYCTTRCSMASNPVYEPAIFDPVTRKWSARGSLAEAARPRMYHSVAVLLPDCRVMTSGSDVTFDQTAELYSPPYLSLGPRPVIVSAPDSIQPGDVLSVRYNSTDPVDRAIFIRAGSFTHSMPFGARALWLLVSSNAGGVMTLRTPVSGNKLPPGLYMLNILSTKGVPAVSKMVRVYPAAPAEAAASPGEDSRR